MKKASIQEYWNERARREKDECSTTNDIFLRELEAKTLAREIEPLALPKASEILDVGCGDGLTTLRLAERFPNYVFTGIDYAPDMIKKAQKHLLSRPASAARFLTADVLHLDSFFSAGRFAAAITDRCLINLGSFDDQKRAIEAVAQCVAAGGYYIAVENFVEGQDNMNRARRALGLPEIPVRWHNLFFREADFRRACAPWFEEPRFLDFAGGYYFATRLLYAAMCRLERTEPDYRHGIHRIAVDLPPTGMWSPIRMAIMRRRG